MVCQLQGDEASSFVSGYNSLFCLPYRCVHRTGGNRYGVHDLPDENLRCKSLQFIGTLPLAFPLLFFGGARHRVFLAAFLQ